MMAKTYMSLCGHIYEEKIVADSIDERENNGKMDFHLFLKDVMVNQFGLISIATEVVHSFVDYTVRAVGGHRTKLMGMLLGVIHPHLFTPLASEAMQVLFFTCSNDIRKVRVSLLLTNTCIETSMSYL